MAKWIKAIAPDGISSLLVNTDHVMLIQMANGGPEAVLVTGVPLKLTGTIADQDLDSLKIILEAV